eukprot:14333294-Heterocapsa_arctica.AAC.1
MQPRGGELMHGAVTVQSGYDDGLETININEIQKICETQVHRQETNASIETNARLVEEKDHD